MEEDSICYDVLPTSRTEADMQRAMFIQGYQTRVMATLGVDTVQPSMYD
jgi:hypothetical protein